jgi:hypothetical protein
MSGWWSFTENTLVEYPKILMHKVLQSLYPFRTPNLFQRVLQVCLLLSPCLLSAQAETFLPDPAFNPLKIRVNLVILQREDGSGNFQDSPEDRLFLEHMMDITNAVYANLNNRNEEYYPGKHLPFQSNAKVRFEPNLIFVKYEYGWNNRNDSNFAGVPYLSGWYLDSLDKAIYGDETRPKAINLYFSNDGQLYEQMVIAGSTTDYNKLVFFKQHAASEIPILQAGTYHNGKYHTMRGHIGNVWLKLWWKRHVLHEIDWYMEDEVGKSIAHELGHLMGLGHTPDAQKHALMRTQFGGQRDYLTTQEISQIHQSFCLYPSLFQVVEETFSYGAPQSEWIITGAQHWKEGRRIYANLVLQPGAELSVSGTLFLPPEGRITVAEGATLILNGVTIHRLGAGQSNLFLQDMELENKGPVPLPQPYKALTTPQGGTVLLIGDASVEEAILGVQGEK